MKKHMVKNITAVYRVEFGSGLIKTYRVADTPGPAVMETTDFIASTYGSGLANAIKTTRKEEDAKKPDEQWLPEKPAE